MKYGKYCKLAAADPLVRRIVEERSGPQAYKDERKVKRFVTERLEFLAFRPWESLDLQSGAELSIEQNVPNAYLHQHYWRSSRWMVYIWIGGEKLPRARSVAEEWAEDGDRTEELTIQGTIENIRKWHKSVEDQIGQIRWAAVVKTSANGGVVTSPIRIEIYPFPEDYK